MTPWAVALSMGFSSGEQWSGLPFPSPRDLSNPGIEPRSPALQADSLPSEPSRKPKYIENKHRKKLNILNLTDIKKRWQEYREELYKKDLHNSNNHNGVITHLEPAILECEIKWP